MGRVVKGKNDLWTTHPEVAKLLLNKDDGYALSKESHKKADFKCPNCGTIIRNKIVRSVGRYGLKCPNCSDGISYPEKLVSCLLDFLKVAYIRDSALPWSCDKRYDFYIENMSLIIETHGVQHYSSEKVFNKDNTRDEAFNDAHKRKLALDNGIKNYVELDCRNSDFNYIKNSILNSELVSIFDFDNVDWNQVGKNSLKSKVLEVCDVYNGGIKSTKKIANMLNLDSSTVTDYLGRCAAVGLCDYSPDRHKQIICVDTGEIYPSLQAVSDAGFNMSQVSECCNGTAKTCGGYNWCFYDEYNPNIYVIKKPKIDNTPKRVLCIETGDIYESLTSVAEDGFSPSAVSRVCRGQLPHHKKFHFEYI